MKIEKEKNPRKQKEEDKEKKAFENLKLEWNGIICGRCGATPLHGGCGNNNHRIR